SSENITAPMPGTITNILVKDGDSVKKGQVLAILEAMKMENEIVAPRDGAITVISVDKGQNVNPGDTLLQMA
ncbi:biotin/lipoyl-containing protein, partial [Romboutsia ilealis]